MERSITFHCANSAGFESAAESAKKFFLNCAYAYVLRRGMQLPRAAFQGRDARWCAELPVDAGGSVDCRGRFRLCVPKT